MDYNFVSHTFEQLYCYVFEEIGIFDNEKIKKMEQGVKIKFSLTKRV